MATKYTRTILLGLLLILLPMIAAAGIICPEGKVCINNPIGGATGAPISPFELYGRLVQGMLMAVGAVALLFFIIGGFTWLTAAGNSEKIKKGRDILVWTTLGMVIVFGSYVIISYIIAVVTGAASGA